MEHSLGVPFAGRSGRELWRWMERAGFASEEEFRRLCYITAMMRCFPGRLPSGAGDRRPPAEAVANCSKWLSNELAFLRPVGVLLVGGLAISSFLGPGPLAEFVGRSFADARLGDRVIPLPHPSGQSRWLNSAANRARLEEALELVRESVSVARASAAVRS